MAFISSALYLQYQMQISSESEWVKLPESRNWRIQYCYKKPMSQSKSSAVYYGRAECKGKQFEVVVKKYIRPVDQQLSKKIRKANSLVLKPYNFLIVSNQGKEGKQEKRYSQVFDYCNNDTLYSLLHLPKQPQYQFQETTILSIIGSIIAGYNSLKQQGINHDDLSLKSIFIHNRKILIGDIGRKPINLTSQQDFYSIMYTCPESIYRQLVERGEYKHSEEKRDIYSLGMIFFYLIYRTHPYANEQFYSTLEKEDKNNPTKEYQPQRNLNRRYIDYLIKNKPQPLVDKKTTLQNNYKDCLEMIMQMISINPDKRPDYQTVYENFQVFTKQIKVLPKLPQLSYLEQNDIQFKGYSTISKYTDARMSFFSTESCLSVQSVIQEINTAYIEFLAKTLSTIQNLTKPPLETIKGSKRDIQQLVDILQEILDRETDPQPNQEEELLISMTVLVSAADTLLFKISEVHNEQEIQAVRCLLDCHSIFVMKQKFEGKYQKQISAQQQLSKDGSRQSQIKQINRMCADYLIPQKRLID